MSQRVADWRMLACVACTLCSGCATVPHGTPSFDSLASAGSAGDALAPSPPPPNLVQAHDWDEVFARMLHGCPDPAQGSLIDPATGFALVWTGASLGVGTYLIANRPFDEISAVATAIAAGTVIFDVAGLVSRVRTRNELTSQRDVIRTAWRDRWDKGNPDEKQALLDEIAITCDEQPQLAEARKRFNGQ